jgi:hypothetical protein
MKRQDEARHRSEEIDIDVFEEALDAIRRRITKVDRSHDIPFIAGSSKDGKTIFIDRHLPPTFTHLLKKIRIEPFIVVHEKVEKALLDELGLHYLHAHQIALRMEREAVKEAGVSWRAYQSFMKKYEKPISEEHLKKVPHNLELQPYRDEKEFSLLERMVKREK